MKLFKKSIYAGFVAFILVAGITSIAVADTKTNSHSGMNMGGSQTQTQESNTSEQQTQPGQGHEAMAGMPGMESMTNDTNNATVEKHESMPGMDPNMPGMETEGHGKISGHGDEDGASKGVNWPVVGSFLAINALVITVAGILKPKSFIS